MQATYRYSWLWFLVAILIVPTAYGQGETVLGAYFMNGNTNVFSSRIYLWNPSDSPGDVTVRVFTLPLTSGMTQELTTTPLALGTLGAKSAFNIKLAEDILTPIGASVPYTADGGNLTLEFTIGVSGVQGVAQVFSGDFAFGTYPLQVISATGTNTATGNGALQNNTTVGDANTASGRGALFSNTTGLGNTSSGVSALPSNTTGFHNVAMGFEALSSNTIGNNNTAIGHAANVLGGNLTNATAIGSLSVVNASNKVRIGNSDVTVIEGQVAFTSVSDRNQKENFKPVDGEQVLEKIREIPVQSWNYIGHDPKEFRHYGPVAQDFFAAFGHDDIGTVGTPTTINSGDMQGILLIAVQALEILAAEQREVIERLKARLEELETGYGNNALSDND